eukprot:TRINITY_DN714_c0_g1_i19.p1 TRINITY_DN714_c0_g1~~TRINITY_DN714_c0_g1_i19.p1  ORF type:complete len:184 (+),score=44.62 TRINITY_DN714_c0_g1_i19:56-553(+)
MGQGSSHGLTFGIGDGGVQGSVLSAGGPYANDITEMEVRTQIYAHNSDHRIPHPFPYSRCTMFHRAKELCYAQDYTHDSSKNKCRDEREDYLNCIYRGKQQRFMLFFGEYLSREDGERNYVKHMSNWEKTRYDEDQGDVLQRALNVQKIYHDKGLKGPKWQGNHD